MICVSLVNIAYKKVNVSEGQVKMMDYENSVNFE